MMLQQLVRVSMYAASALDRAAMAVAYGEEAAAHYREPYTLACGLRNWALGFREGWALARSRDIEVCDMARAAGVPVEKARTALAKGNSIDAKRELMSVLCEASAERTH